MRTFSLLLLLIFFGTGCRKDLCYNHPHEGSVILNVDWVNLPSDSKKPNGVLALFIRTEDGQSQSVNFPSEGGSRNLTQGSYDIMVTNNDSELVLFRNMTSWSTAEAFTSAKRQPPYKSAPSNVPNAAAPESRYGISESDLLMCSNEGKVYVTEDVNKKQVITVAPQCLVIPITVRILVSGVKNVSEARGYLTGVSPSVFLGSLALSQSDATVLFNYGSAAGGTELKSQFNIFGMVDKANDHYILALELLLIDQKTVLFYTFNVDDQITSQLRSDGGTIRISETIVIPDVDPPSPGGGGFKPGIGGWEEEENIEINNPKKP